MHQLLRDMEIHPLKLIPVYTQLLHRPAQETDVSKVIFFGDFFFKKYWFLAGWLQGELSYACTQVFVRVYVCVCACASKCMQCTQLDVWLHV